MDKEILDQLILMNKKLDKLIEVRALGQMHPQSMENISPVGDIRKRVEKKIADAKRAAERKMEEAKQVQAI